MRIVLLFGLFAEGLMWGQDYARIDRLRSEAKAAFQREMAREKAGDCYNTNTTYATNTCLSKENETSSANWHAFSAAIRGLLDSRSQEEFDKAQGAWETYRHLQCSAASGLYKGGSIAPGTELSCNLLLLRSHLRELEAVYSDTLNN